MLQNVVYHQQITSFIPCDLGFALLFLMIRYAFLLKVFVPHFLGLSHLLGVDKYVVYNEFKRISKVGHFTQFNFHDIHLPSHNLKLIRVLVQKKVDYTFQLPSLD